MLWKIKSNEMSLNSEISNIGLILNLDIVLLDINYLIVIHTKVFLMSESSSFESIRRIKSASVDCAVVTPTSIKLAIRQMMEKTFLLP